MSGLIVTEVRTEATTVGVLLVGGRPRVRIRSGLLRAQQVHGPDAAVRIALIANTALLLGGDRVELDVEVGPGAQLEVFEVAGTVAYHGRGASASWSVRAAVADQATLIMTGGPFVVADGADVERTTRVDLAGTGAIRLRETVVLGRSGEEGGRLRNRTMINRDGAALLHEDQQLDPESRRLPGLLGAARVIDTLTTVGTSLDGFGPLHRLGGPAAGGRVARFELLDSAGTVVRWIGSETSDSPLHGWSRC